MSATVKSLKVWPAGPDPAAVPPAYRAQLPQDTRPVWVEAVLENTGLAYANALRRGVLEETPGYALDIPDTAELRTNDQHYRDDIATNLRSLPLDVTALDAQDAGALRYQLAARNDSAAYVPLTSAALVPASKTGGSSGAGGRSLFNRTVAIGPPLQPGGYIAIDDIRVVAGVGRVTGNPAAASELDPLKATLGHPGFSAACRATLLPLDVDPNATSSLVAAPRRHQLRFKLKAVAVDADMAAAAQRYLIRVCAALRSRLRTETLTNARRLQISEGLATLELPGETNSVGNALSAAVLEVRPDVTYVGARAIPHEAIVRLTVQHPDADDLPAIVSDAVQHVIDEFSALEQGFRSVATATLKASAAPPNAGKRVPPPAAVFEDESGAVSMHAAQ